MPDSLTFTPARQVTERHACVVALESPPNGGKSWSGCRLAKGMAEAQGKRFAVLDTEGGRTLHLKNDFDFDIMMMSAPHRPERYLEAAQKAEAAGYGALLIDSFSNVWRGIGGVLHWADDELEEYVARQKGYAQQYNRTFDESKARNAGKQSSLIRPKVAFKFMMAGLLDIRMPIVLSIRGEVSYDPDTKKEIFKTHMQKGIGFDVTCRFRLMPAAKGIIDTTDSEKFKMEGAHAAIFKNGQQLSEEHGAALNAWATGGTLPGQGPDKATLMAEDLIAKVKNVVTEEALLDVLTGETEAKQVAWLKERRPELLQRLNDATAAKRAALQGGEQSSSGALL